MPWLLMQAILIVIMICWPDEVPFDRSTHDRYDQR